MIGKQAARCVPAPMADPPEQSHSLSCGTWEWALESSHSTAPSSHDPGFGTTQGKTSFPTEWQSLAAENVDSGQTDALLPSHLPY